MEWLFGKRLTPEEIVKQHQRTIQRSIREIERERRKLEQNEPKLINDIKKAARDHQLGAAKIMAKDLVRTRQHIQKMYKMKTQLQAVSLRIQTIKSQAAMSNAMKGVTRAMMRMNAQINLPSLQRILMEFQKQSEMMDMKEETIGETMDEMWSDDEEEAETDDVINQILDEIGINLETQLVKAPENRKAAATTAEPARAMAAEPAGGGGAGGPADDQDLQDRLNNLRKLD